MNNHRLRHKRLTLTAVRQAQGAQIVAQRKGRAFEKKVSFVGTLSNAGGTPLRYSIGYRPY